MTLPLLVVSRVTSVVLASLVATIEDAAASTRAGLVPEPRDACLALVGVSAPASVALMASVGVTRVVPIAGFQTEGGVTSCSLLVGGPRRLVVVVDGASTAARFRPLALASDVLVADMRELEPLALACARRVTGMVAH